MRNWIIGLLVLATVIGFTPAAMADNHEDQRAVIVTGASSGIGRYVTERLASEGFFVYAGARKPEDIAALNEIDNVEAVRLDVTVQEDIDAAVETVVAGGRGLYGIVNNAGVFIGGPLTDVSVDELHWIMDVNVYGVYRVTKAFAPMVIESGGRITTIGSISGILAGPFGGHYSMTKHAIEAYTDSLAAEMAMVGVAVSVVEPGNYDSKIAESALRRMQDENAQYARDGSPFAERFDEWLDRDWDRSVYKPPHEVAEAVFQFFTADEPLRRYMVVPAEDEASRTINQIIQELVQLNEGQAYSYSRDELVAMLDAVLSPPKEEPAAE
jgi:NAD(P)-dependent dehydrogenase (short-subunit alcohol dehydrogenase family)